MNPISVPVLFVGLGLVLRIILPYLVARLDAEGPLSFDFRYVIGQVLANIVAYIPSMFDPLYLAGLGGLAPLVLVGIGWGFSDMGREAHKLLEVITKK